MGEYSRGASANGSAVVECVSPASQMPVAWDVATGAPIYLSAHEVPLSVAPDGKDLLTAPAAPNPLASLGGGAAASAVYTGGAPAAPAFPAVDVSKATNVVLLANMVTAEEVANETEMAEILEDTKTECEKRGKVRAAMVVVVECFGAGSVHTCR